MSQTEFIDRLFNVISKSGNLSIRYMGIWIVRDWRMGVIDICFWCVLLIAWIISWIYTIIDIIRFRKRCEVCYLQDKCKVYKHYLSEYCLRRFYMTSKEREEIRKLIDKLD